MRVIKLLCVVIMLVIWSSQAHSATLTFDYTGPHWGEPNTHGWEYGIKFGTGFRVVDHTGSSWGTPHSGTNVLIIDPVVPVSFAGIAFIHVQTGHPKYAYTFGGYFSTRPGTVLEIRGYKSDYPDPVALISIGAPDVSWNNVYVQMSSSEGFDSLFFTPVTPDALHDFCIDDMTVDFVPELSALLALGAGLAGLAIRRRR